MIVCEAMYAVFHSNFAACILCRLYKPCEFLEFVWTDCWGNKSNYVITSPANIDSTHHTKARVKSRDNKLKKKQVTHFVNVNVEQKNT